MRISRLAWSTADPDSTLTTNVINGFSDLILEVYGLEAGTRAWPQAW
jgi:hypothetical protein